MFIYRANIQGSERLVEGYYFKTSKAHYIHPIGPNFGYVEIEYDTLAVHHPQMLAEDSLRLLPDGSKDLRIFAALIKNGGDIIKKGIKEYQLMFDSVEMIPYYEEWDNYSIIGIKL